MTQPKFRLFGGPNGSGKTHVFKQFKRRGYIHTEIYVNADKIEAGLKKKGKFYFNAFRVKVDDADFKNHITSSGLYNKIGDKSFIDHFSIRSGVLHIGKNVSINSYHASFIASYLAERLFLTGQSFAFETVMSHSSKVDLIHPAKANGYKTYLYFIFLDDISTNVARVQLRVLQGEHTVEEETIKSRAPRTFELLPHAFAVADSAYIIDNSIEAISILSKESSAITVSESYPEIIKPAVDIILKQAKRKYKIKS